MISYSDVDNYIEGNVETSQDARGYKHYTWGADAMELPIYADYVSRTTVNDDNEVIVAILDSGIKAEHELFQGRLLQGYDYYENDDVPEDEQGHGTHVAGIIADCTQGLNVKLLPIKVLDVDPWTLGSQGRLEQAIAGIQFAVAQGADVINLSLGSTSPSYERFCTEIDDAVSQGIVVVALLGIHMITLKQIPYIQLIKLTL